MIFLENSIKVFDDLLTDFQKDFFETLVYGDSLGEKILPSIDFSIKYEATAVEDGKIPITFNHILKSSAKTSIWLDNFAIIPQLVCRELKTQLLDIYFARIYLSTPYPTTLERYTPHTDLAFPHWVVIYYVNDSEGDTVFYDQRNNIIKTVNPKKGRIVFFNGSIKHSGGIPKYNPRCLVNYNIRTTKNELDAGAY